jgi:hypothetical protein
MSDATLPPPGLRPSVLTLPDSSQPRRRIDSAGGSLALLETAHGDTDVIGPEVTHRDCETLARQILRSTSERCPVPVTMHKLALAYLAARGLTEVS